MKTTIKTLLGSIKEMPNHDRGICGQPAMMSLSQKAFDAVRQTMTKWPKYSGDYDYPVPSTMEGRTPSQCFHDFHDKLKDLWNRNTEYGALRWELLDWLTKQPELDVPLYKISRGGVLIMFDILSSIGEHTA